LPNNDSPPGNPDVTARRSWTTTFDALTVRNYRWYWAGSLASFFADQMNAPTQAWLTYQLTHSALLLGLVSAIQGIPRLIIAPFSGVVIDRMQKRNIIMISQSVSVATYLTIAILVTTGLIQYWHLLASAVLTGVAWSFNSPTRNSIAAELVPREKLYNAIALNNGALNTARIVGPALAGVLIGLIGTQGAYYVGVGFNILAITTISFLPPTSKLGLTSGKSMIYNLVEGFRYLRINNTILIIIGMEVVVTFFGMSYQGLMPIFAGLLNTSSRGYGLMMSAYGVGALIASLGVASLGNFKKKGRLLIIAGAFFGATLVLFANTGLISDSLHLGANSLYLAIFCLAMVGISMAAYTATSLTVIQINISDEFRGRVTSVFQMVIALYPISVFTISALAQAIGAPAALTIGGGALTLFMIFMFLFSGRIRRAE